MACIVPPEGWAPPFALEKGTNGHSMESFRFLIRKQLTSQLCMRAAKHVQEPQAAGLWPVRIALLTGSKACCRWWVHLHKPASKCRVVCPQIGNI